MSHNYIFCIKAVTLFFVTFFRQIEAGFFPCQIQEIFLVKTKQKLNKQGKIVSTLQRG
jgi:hypothetical protein